jgi:hypothetical protein
MNLDDVMPDPKQLEFEPVPAAEARALWPQARYELLAYARWLGRHNAELTARQMRLAVQLADAGLEGGNQ